MPLAFGCRQQAQEPSKQPQSFPLSAIRLLDGPFAHAAEMNAAYVMAHDPDRLLAPFLADAGLEPKAERFSHQLLLQPLLQHEDKLTGMHANTQIPKVIGFMQISRLKNDSAWHDASRFFWETVVQNRSIAIGGNSTHEHFHPTDNFSSFVRL